MVSMCRDAAGSHAKYILSRSAIVFAALDLALAPTNNYLGGTDAPIGDNSGKLSQEVEPSQDFQTGSE